MNNTIKNEMITSRATDFAQWYTDVCKKAELMDYSSVKGFIIYRPYGYAIWEQIQNYLDNKFKMTGHENVYMPMVMPESLLNKEKEHIEGFAPETLICTIGGKEKLEERLIVRPTSEVLFCEHYSKIINSHRDLPKLYNQWCSVVRWEKTTRPFLRGSEFLWQEGHTMHSNEEEAKYETLHMLDIYSKMGENLLAIPFVTGRKTEKEKFAGAVETYAIEALMHDGKALQSGTTHYFGDGFSKAFDVKFQDKDNSIKNPFQTSWGVSTRLIGAVIMVHGDDNGLSLPPYIAPTQVVIIPIQDKKPEVVKKVNELHGRLKEAGIRVKLDSSNRTPGWKFSEYEMKGVPIRLEVGPRDIENGVLTLVVRHNGEKITIADNELEAKLEPLMKKIHSDMYAKALQHLEENTIEVNSLEQLIITVNNGGYAKTMWCECQECEDKVKELTSAKASCMPFNQTSFNDNCAICGKPAKKVVLFAKTY